MRSDSYVKTYKLILWILSHGYFIKIVHTAEDFENSFKIFLDMFGQFLILEYIYKNVQIKNKVR